jgi:hypothetical protein
MKKVIAILAFCFLAGAILCHIPGGLGTFFATAGGLALIAIGVIAINLLALKLDNKKGLDIGGR